MSKDMQRPKHRHKGAGLWIICYYIVSRVVMNQTSSSMAQSGCTTSEYHMTRCIQTEGKFPVMKITEKIMVRKLKSYKE